jgi:hypothetical protein
VDVVAVHGDKDQLERLEAIRDFKTGGQGPGGGGYMCLGSAAGWLAAPLARCIAALCSTLLAVTPIMCVLSLLCRSQLGAGGTSITCACAVDCGGLPAGVSTVLLGFSLLADAPPAFTLCQLP